MTPAKSVCIHIGSDKAGSTAIQAFAFRNAVPLAQRGLHVVPSRFDHHGPIRQELVAGGRAELDRAVEAIRRSPAPRHLLTFEGFYHLEGERLDTFVRAFDGLALEVVYYVRRRSDHFRSGAAQNMKLNKAERRDKDCGILFGGEYPRQLKLHDYAATVRRWQKALRRAGWPDAFRLRVYEKSSFVGGDLLVDFFSRLGVLRADESPQKAPFVALPGSINPSLSPAAQYLMVMSHVLGLDDRRRRQLKDLMVAADDPAARKHTLVPDELAHEMDRRHEAQDRELAREFLGRDTLFVEPPQFVHAPPGSQAFVDLLRGLYERRAQLSSGGGGEDD